jgi:RNA polymerase sigma-70 factor, ECF subfamily
VNECYDYLRKKKVRKLVYEADLGEDDQRSIENSPLATDRSMSIDAAAEKRQYLMKLLERVSEEERMLLIQKEVEGLTVEELSEMTGVNANTIKVKLFRARQKLILAAQKLDKATA